MSVTRTFLLAAAALASQVAAAPVDDPTPEGAARKYVRFVDNGQGHGQFMRRRSQAKRRLRERRVRGGGG